MTAIREARAATVYGLSAECAGTRTGIGGVRFPGHTACVAKDGKSEPNVQKPFDTARATHRLTARDE